MQFAPHSALDSAQKMKALAAAELIEMIGKQEREIVNLRRQVAWFQRQIFGQKSERRLPEADGVQGTLGESFDAVPDAAPPNKKTRVASHERESKPNKPTDGADESSLFFDEQKVPVEVINVPNAEAAGLTAGEFEVIGEKVSHRLAQRPGSYVFLKYVRPLIKRRDTQILSCPAAPAGVIDGSRADVSFIAGMMVDKFAFHLPLYRQHQRLRDAGIDVSRPWLAQLMQASAALLEPIHAAQLDSIRASRVKAMDETPIKAGRAGPGKMKAAYFWPVYGEQDEICFLYYPSRAAKHVEEALGPARPGRTGIGIDWRRVRGRSTDPGTGFDGSGEARVPTGAREAGGRSLLRLDRQTVCGTGLFTQQSLHLGAGLHTRAARGTRSLSRRPGRGDRHQPSGARITSDSDGPQKLVIQLDRTRRQAGRHRAEPAGDLPVARHQSVRLFRRCAAACRTTSGVAGPSAHAKAVEAAVRRQSPAFRSIWPDHLTQ